MKLLEQLQATDALASASLTKKTVKMPGGDVDVWVRDIPERELSQIYATNDGKVRARLINAGLREEDGAVAITVEKAGQLLGTAAHALQVAILEVNGRMPSEDLQKNSESEDTSGSGESSLSDSDAPLAS
jgi:hypothetical protein